MDSTTIRQGEHLNLTYTPAVEAGVDLADGNWTCTVYIARYKHQSAVWTGTIETLISDDATFAGVAPSSATLDLQGVYYVTGVIENPVLSQRVEITDRLLVLPAQSEA